MGSVDVYKRSFDRRSGESRHGQAIMRRVQRIQRNEAAFLVYHHAARWTGKSERGIELMVPIKSMLLVVGQMRYRGSAAEACAIDNRTHKRERLTYRHVRNESYYDCLNRIGVVEMRAAKDRAVSPSH